MSQQYVELSISSWCYTDSDLFDAFVVYNMSVWTAGGQLCNNCQVTFVNLKCESSKKPKIRQTRNPSNKEITRITLELEAEIKPGDTTGKCVQLNWKSE